MGHERRKPAAVIITQKQSNFHRHFLLYIAIKSRDGATQHSLKSFLYFGTYYSKMKRIQEWF